MTFNLTHLSKKSGYMELPAFVLQEMQNKKTASLEAEIKKLTSENKALEKELETGERLNKELDEHDL